MSIGSGITHAYAMEMRRLLQQHQSACEECQEQHATKPEPLPARRAECGKRHLIHSSGRVMVCHLPEGHPGPCEGPRRTEAA